MKKRLICLLLTLVMLLAMLPAASAVNSEQQNAADALNSLQMFLGTDKGYELENSLTREQGVMLLLRMLGQLSAAEKSSYQHPFRDVRAAYYNKYLAYAYATKLTSGTGATTFGFGEPMTEQMFLTFCLRALGYSDTKEANYVWNNAFLLAFEKELIFVPSDQPIITRGDAVVIFCNALDATLADGSMTLADKLILDGVFTAEDYAKALRIRTHGKEAALQKDCAHVEVVSVLTKEPTCETTGERAYLCKDCGTVIRAETVPALGHDFVYNCNAVQHWGECSICGKTTAAEAHVFSGGTVCTVCGYGCDHHFADTVKQPTCTQMGYTEHTCTHCGYSYRGNYVAALGHAYEGKVTKPATCTEDGTTTYTCTRCGDHYDKTDILAHGHDYVGKVTKEAKCTEKGVTTYTCTYCKDSYEKEDIPALGHLYVGVITKAPTATSSGTMTYTCSRCQDSYTESIPAKAAKDVTWEEYQAMSGTEKDAFFAMFSDPADFISWMNAAQKAYQDQQESVVVDSGGSIDISK